MAPPTSVPVDSTLLYFTSFQSAIGITSTPINRPRFLPHSDSTRFQHDAAYGALNAFILVGIALVLQRIAEVRESHV